MEKRPQKGGAPLTPVLTKRREDTAKLIERQIQLGEQLAARAQFERDPEPIAAAEKLWFEYTRQLLLTLFTDAGVPNEFHLLSVGAWEPKPDDHLRNLRMEIRDCLGTLRSIHLRVELFEEQSPHNASPAQSSVQSSETQDVFIVHGRDESLKQAVARFLEKLGLSPVILHEKPDEGRTVIEKFEDHTSVGFAVVLLTGDDEGRLRGAEELEIRARQNVILELGYFVGKLGRKRVCALKMDGVETPSDLHGVLYVPVDSGGAWKLALARELKAAGVNIDLNLVVSLPDRQARNG